VAKVVIPAEKLDLISSLLEGMRVGLVVNHTSLTPDLRHLKDLLSSRVELVAIFSPEHGFWGCSQAGDFIENSVDEETGLPIYSLYR